MGVINGKSFSFLIQGLTLYDCLMIADESFKAKDFTSAWLWSRYAWTATTHPEMKAYVSRLMAAVSKEVDRTSCNNSGLITHTYTPSVHVAYTRCDYIANVSLVLRNDWYVMKTPGICNDTAFRSMTTPGTERPTISLLVFPKARVRCRTTSLTIGSVGGSISW